MTTPDDTPDIETILSLPCSRFYPRIEKPDPITDIREHIGRAMKSLTTFAFAGPIPVDFTLASAALNRGEGAR